MSIWKTSLTIYILGLYFIQNLKWRGKKFFYVKCGKLVWKYILKLYLHIYVQQFILGVAKSITKLIRNIYHLKNTTYFLKVTQSSIK